MRGSWGVSPTGTAEPNPTAPAGRIKPRINNGETGHLWLGTKQYLDRNTNGFSVLTASTFLPLTRLSHVLKRHLQHVASPSVHLIFFFKMSLQLKACATISFPFKVVKKQKNISPHLKNLCYCSHLTHSQDLHVTARHDSLLVLLCQTELPEECG